MKKVIWKMKIKMISEIKMILLIIKSQLDRLISLKERDINDELVRKNFLVQNLGALLENLRKLRNTEQKQNSGRDGQKWIKRLKRRN